MKAPATVQAALRKIDTRWERLLPPDVLACPAESVVGEIVVRICSAQSALFAQFNNEDEQLERDVIAVMEQAVVRQASVWLFG